MQQITNTHAIKGRKTILSLSVSWLIILGTYFFAEAYIYRIWFPFICWSFRRLFGFYPIPYRNDLSL